MKCAYCKGQTEHGETNFMIDIDNCFIIVKSVPGQVCSQCGEAIYDTETAKKLEKIINIIRSSLTTEIAVVKFSDNVA